MSDHPDSDTTEYAYDIVILDNLMNGIQGIDALAAARAAGWWGVVIMCSSCEDPELQARFAEHADLVLSKEEVGREGFKAAFHELGWPRCGGN